MPVRPGNLQKYYPEDQHLPAMLSQKDPSNQDNNINEKIYSKMWLSRAL